MALDCRVASLLAMTVERTEFQSTFAGTCCGAAVFATRAAFAISASAAIFFCGSDPGCTTPADMISEKLEQAGY